MTEKKLDQTFQKLSSEEKASEKAVENPRIAEINKALTTLVDLCKVEPVVSIICSLDIPSGDENSDGTIISIYAGSSPAQVHQLDLLTQHEPQFEHDLSQFLSHRIKQKMDAEGTTGNTLADQMLANINESETKLN